METIFSLKMARIAGSEGREVHIRMSGSMLEISSLLAASMKANPEILEYFMFAMDIYESGAIKDVEKLKSDIEDNFH